MQTYEEKHREKRRGEKLKHRYGLTLEAYEKLFVNQKGLCAICGKFSAKPLQVDHCHETNALRALLCSHCNRMLGAAFDSPDKLRAAANYIESFAKEAGVER
jgi:hypothetical protein